MPLVSCWCRLAVWFAAETQGHRVVRGKRGTHGFNERFVAVRVGGALRGDQASDPPLSPLVSVAGPDRQVDEPQCVQLPVIVHALRLSHLLALPSLSLSRHAVQMGNATVSTTVVFLSKGISLALLERLACSGCRFL